MTPDPDAARTFYQQVVHGWAIDASARPRLKAYRARLLAHPAVAKSIEGARPYRHYFPLGSPDRD